MRQDYRRNRQIRIPEVRLIDAEGNQVGVVQTRDAQRMAEEANLDLVEVSPNARPPVCRIMDFGKFKYEQNKRDKQGAGRKSLLKEMRVRPAIDKHDLSYRTDQGRQFLEKGNKVQVVCIFRGRQMRHPEHGYNVMRQVVEDLKDVCKVEVPARLMGRRMTMMLAPSGKPSAKSGGSSTTSDKPPRQRPPPRVQAPAGGVADGAIDDDAPLDDMLDDDVDLDDDDDDLEDDLDDDADDVLDEATDDAEVSAGEPRA